MNDSTKTALLFAATGIVLFAGWRIFASSGPRALKKAKRIACLGDSLTAAPHGYCADLGARLVVNTQAFGYPSQGTAAIGEHVDDVLAWVSDAVVVLAGVNDLPNDDGAQRAIRGLTSIYQKIRSAGVPVVAVQITPWHGYPSAVGHEGNTFAVNDWIRRRSNVDAVVDTSSMGDDKGGLLPQYDDGSGLHLSIEGHAELARLIAVQAFGR